MWQLRRIPLDKSSVRLSARPSEIVLMGVGQLAITGHILETVNLDFRPPMSEIMIMMVLMLMAMLMVMLMIVKQCLRN